MTFPGNSRFYRDEHTHTHKHTHTHTPARDERQMQSKWYSCWRNSLWSWVTVEQTTTQPTFARVLWDFPSFYLRFKLILILINNRPKQQQQQQRHIFEITDAYFAANNSICVNYLIPGMQRWLNESDFLMKIQFNRKSFVLFPSINCD